MGRMGMNVRECYIEISGDYETVKERITSDEKLLRYLKKYAATNLVDRMFDAFDSEDYKQVFELSHELKGMSANLELKGNNSTITQICDSVRGGIKTIDITELMAKAKAEHEHLIKIVNLIEE